MKALFSRWNRGLTGQKEREKEREIGAREKPPSVQLPKLPEWPPNSSSAKARNSPATSQPRVTSTVDSVASVDKPLPTMPAVTTNSMELGRPTPRPVNPSVATIDSAVAGLSRTLSPQSSVVDRQSRKPINGSIISSSATETTGKKVAFIPEAPESPPTAHVPPTMAGSQTIKTNVSRFQAAQSGGKEPRASTSSDSGSKVEVNKATTTKGTSPRNAVSPYPQSLRTNTPYSQMTNTSSRILAAASWSEGAESDLVSNLGPRERTRQEVLWEIVASEERYVGELIKMKDTFIEPMLHPFAPQPASPTDFDDYSRYDTPAESVEQLPIASRFMSPLSFRAEDPDTNSETPDIEDEEEHEANDRMGQSLSQHGHQRSPYTAHQTPPDGRVAFPTRSHQSLPYPPRHNANKSAHSLNRQPSFNDRERRRRNNSAPKPVPSPRSVISKLRKHSSAAVDVPLAPRQLPEALRVCLEVVESGILDGHLHLSEGLRKRYDEQYPLVRSLADVFVSNSHIFHGYATYVLHLERALEYVDNALSTSAATKKPKNQDAAEWLRVCKVLQRLEQTAADKGETGLAISLSKPFQRLLKYPLLFQNLLYHTDPSTFEYESTLQMVAEVEMIVRSIEDEKIQKEDRDKTRDVWARIEGLEKVKELAVPKMSRMLVEERSLLPADPSTNNSPTSSKASPSSFATRGGKVKGKSSFKRLSDVLGSASGLGSKKDLWLVVFNDVVLQCQRTGTTTLPLVSDPNARATSLPEGKAKYASTGRRAVQTKPRNLYKYVKIETWDIGDGIQLRNGAVNMEDVVLARSQLNQPKIVPMPDDDDDDGEGDSDDSGKKSKMSFSYWGADKVTVQKPVIKPRQPSNLGNTRRVSPSTGSYGRESSANAKFGTRLVAGESTTGTRTVSRRAGTVTPTSVARRPIPPSDDGNFSKATVTRPEWNSNTRSPRSVTPTSVKRIRNTSQGTALTATSPTPRTVPT